MNKKSIILLLMAISYAFSSHAQSGPSAIHIQGNLYAITNAGGGNIAFVVSNEGVIVVDTGYAPMAGDAIVSTIKGITDKPIKYVIYTHLHTDHINGIAAFPDDVIIIGHENIEKNIRQFVEPTVKLNQEKNYPELLQKQKQHIDSLQNKPGEELDKFKKQHETDVKYVEDYKRIKIRYPQITFKNNYELELGEEKIMLRYFGAAHTNDNIVVIFPAYQTIHTADLIFNGMIPWVIADHGANIGNWITTLNELKSQNYSKVIPGHGEIGDNQLFSMQLDYFNGLSKTVRELKQQNKNVEEIHATVVDSKWYEQMKNQGQLKANIQRIFDEAE